jgi:hypothetical protein
MRSTDKSMKLLDFSHSEKLNTKDELVNSKLISYLLDSPEERENEKIDPFKSDIYKFGCSMFIFLFNKFEFNFESNENGHEDLILLKKNYPLAYDILNHVLNSDAHKRPSIDEILHNEFFKEL